MEGGEPPRELHEPECADDLSMWPDRMPPNEGIEGQPRYICGEVSGLLPDLFEYQRLFPIVPNLVFAHTHETLPRPRHVSQHLQMSMVR